MNVTNADCVIVNKVMDGSLAHQAGLEDGDQVNITTTLFAVAVCFHPPADMSALLLECRCEYNDQ